MCTKKQRDRLVAENTEAVTRDVLTKDLVGAQYQGLHYIADPSEEELRLHCRVDDLGPVGIVNLSEVMRIS